MKLLFSCIVMISVGFSLALDFDRPAAAWKICNLGLCRTDQLPTNASYNPKTTSLQEMLLALRLDPANPRLWAQCGEILDNRGDEIGADKYFQRALELGPNITPVLMDSVNHDLIVDRMDRAFKSGSRILRLTPDFDAVLFGLYDSLGPPVPTLLGTAIPTDRRAAGSWMRWLIHNGSEEDLLATWKWIYQNQFADDQLAGMLAWQLWRRGSTHEASDVWADWLGKDRSDYLRPDLLANRRFAADFRQSPFDWKVDQDPSVKWVRKDGIEFTFSGQENVFCSISQFPAVSPGTYKFSAVVESQEITTRQCPQFHIFTVEPATGRVDVSTAAICGTTPRHTVETLFTVPLGVNTVSVRMERLRSDRIDNKISGTIKIHEVSLRRQ